MIPGGSTLGELATARVLPVLLAESVIFLPVFAFVLWPREGRGDRWVEERQNWH